jgi:hypothetical protein
MIQEFEEGEFNNMNTYEMDDMNGGADISN